MGKLLKLILLLALVAGIYAMFIQEKWYPMNSAGLGITALAPAAGERVAGRENDSLLGQYKTDAVTFTADEEAYSISKISNRKISRGGITMSEYEKSLIDDMIEQYQVQHQSSESIKHNGVLGFEVKFLVPDGVTHAYIRVFPHKEALYVATAMTPDSLSHTYRRHRFFSSVEFTE